jgi:hypothetical protein
LNAPAMATPSAGMFRVLLAGLDVDVAVKDGVKPAIPVSENTLIVFRITGVEKLKTTVPLGLFGTAAINILARWKAPPELRISSTEVAAIPSIVAVLVNVPVFRANASTQIKRSAAGVPRLTPVYVPLELLFPKA